MISERDKAIFQSVVLTYIKTAVPVGSGAVCKEFGLSSATIRNIMVNLENEGLLAQPHVSAGRIPTEDGFRYYVDLMLDDYLSGFVMPPAKSEWYKPFNGLDDIANSTDFLSKVTRLLSRTTNYVAIVIPPKATSCILKYIKFILLGNKKVMSILVSREGTVYKNILKVDMCVSQFELDKMSKYLNRVYSGLSIDIIRQKMAKEMKKAERMYDKMAAILITIGGCSFDNAFKSASHAGELFTDGTNNIFDFPEFAKIEKVKSILLRLEEKYTILKMLDKLVVPGKIKVILGSEGSFIGQNDCSTVISGYKAKNGSCGVVGVLGPMRMNYNEVIPIVDYTTSIVSQLMMHLC